MQKADQNIVLEHPFTMEYSVTIMLLTKPKIKIFSDSGRTLYSHNNSENFIPSVRDPVRANQMTGWMECQAMI